MLELDDTKVRREFMRWVMLLALYNGRPAGAVESTLLATAQAMYPDATKHEVRLWLDYLGERGLVRIDKRPDGKWCGHLTRTGTDVVEYAVDCEPGIARPAKCE